MLTTRATEGGVPVTEIRYDEALEALAEAFGERLGWTHPRGEASVSPASVEEARLLAEIAARYSVPLVPLGAGTGNGPNLRGGVQVRFEQMQSLRLPEDDEPWVEAGPGAIPCTQASVNAKSRAGGQLPEAAGLSPSSHPQRLIRLGATLIQQRQEISARLAERIADTIRTVCSKNRR
jgi:hypothetical protein